MDEQILQEAVDNISLIKGVIDRTSKSFVVFSRIFIYWGLLFILNSVIRWLMVINKEQLMDIVIRYPILNYGFPVGIIALLAALIYIQVSKKVALVGLEKHLMKVWLLILIMNVLPSRIFINTKIASIDMSSIEIQSSNLSVVFFSLAIALIVTSMFTGYKQPKYVAFIYIAISLLYAYFKMPIFEGAFQFLFYISLPFTFLYLGFFLKSQHLRGE